MNFRGNKGTGKDFIVSFRLDAKDFETVRDGVYKQGGNKIVDSEIFNREKGAKLDIQASNFEVNRKTPCAKPVSSRDSSPHLYNNVVKAIGTGARNVTHYPDKPDAPSYIRKIFNAAERVEIVRTPHGAVYAACAVNGDIRKFADGYSLDANSVRPVKWEMAKGTFKKQMELTNDTKSHAKNVVMSKAASIDENSSHVDYLLDEFGNI